MLERIRASAEADGNRLLLANVLELMAQQQISIGSPAAGEKLLQESLAILGASGSPDSFHSRKWQAFIHLKGEQGSQGEQSLTELLALKEDALKMKQWEYLRQFDFLVASKYRDAERARYNYFGTPHAHYRLKMRRVFGAYTAFGDYFDLKLGDIDEEKLDSARLFDLETAAEGKDGPHLKRGQCSHRLLAALLSDFYAPFRTATLYAMLYPDEYFNPTTSFARVRQAVRRLRHWLRREKLPLKIEEFHGSYKLTATGPYIIRVPAQLIVADATELDLELLRQAFQTRPFTAKEAATVLERSLRMTQNALSDLRERKNLSQQGRKRSTKYKIAA